LAAGIDAAELLTRCDLASSKGEARRFIEQGGVYVNNVRIEPLQPVNLSSLLHDRYLVIRRGRRQMHLVVIA
jgi:tyrosyl-tRNA synthetase